jgi:hypothetical protein
MVIISFPLLIIVNLANFIEEHFHSENVISSNEDITFSLQSVKSNKNEEIQNLSTKEKTDEIVRIRKNSQLTQSSAKLNKQVKRNYSLPPVPISKYK